MIINLKKSKEENADFKNQNEEYKMNNFCEFVNDT